MTYERLIDDDREAEFYFTYRRVDAKNVDPYNPMGPSYEGDYWFWPVEVSKTQIGFSRTQPYTFPEV